MRHDLDDTAISAFDIVGPIAQARRCLDRWLEEEDRDMPERQRQRAAALMARYFLHEDEVSDGLLLSFLRHYAGYRAVDMDDPAALRLEIKAALDQSAPRQGYPPRWKSAAFAVLVTVLFFVGGDLTGKKLSLWQRADLKARVEKIVSREQGLAPVTVWAQVRKSFDVPRYEDISYWDYPAAREMLEAWESRPRM